MGIYAGSDGNGVMSSSGGSSWTSMNYGLTQTYIHCLAATGTNLFAGTGTWDSGLWRRPVSEMVSVKLASSGLPKEFNLEQNYPNPFNPSTTIRYELPHASRVSLKVYNTLGQEVATLVNETKPAGFFTVTFDAGSLASGVYFYRIVAGSLSETKRLLLNR